MKRIWRWKDGDRIDLILVANKIDLPDAERQVTFQMGKELADKYDVPFIEQSAKTGLNVVEAFEILVRETRKSDVIDDPMPVGTGCGIM